MLEALLGVLIITIAVFGYFGLRTAVRLIEVIERAVGPSPMIVPMPDMRQDGHLSGVSLPEEEDQLYRRDWPSHWDPGA